MNEGVGGTYVEDEKRVFGGHDLGRTVAGYLGGLLMPPNISARSQGNLIACTLEEKDVLNARTILQGSVDDGLGGDGLAASTALIGSNHDAGSAIIYAVPQ